MRLSIQRLTQAIIPKGAIKGEFSNRAAILHHAMTTLLPQLATLTTSYFLDDQIYHAGVRIK
jgi:hypothetical protein